MPDLLKPNAEARDIMEPVPGSLSPEETVQHAVGKMYAGRAAEESCAPPAMVVLDEGGRLVGLVSQHDILRAILPAYMTMVDLADFAWDEMLAEMAVRLAARTVGEIMNADVVSVTEDAPIMECIDLVVLHDLESVPVVDAGGLVVGIVYVRDLYGAVVEALFPRGVDA